MNETNQNNAKECLFCHKIISGRTDKMFCDDRCRNNYYYRVNNQHIAYIRAVNKTLLKNRGILRTLNPNGRKQVLKKYLEELGFDFNCFTGIHKTKKGKLYYLVYDQAYSFEPDDERVSLVVFYRDAESVEG